MATGRVGNKRRKHTWKCIAVFALKSDREAEAAHNPDGNMDVLLNGDTLSTMYVACSVCEHVWGDVKDTPCPGRDVVEVPGK